MFSTIIATVLRTTIACFLLLFLARIIGRKMISQMTFFDFIVGVVVGTICGSLAMVSNNSVQSAVTAMVTLTALTLIIDYVHIKSHIFRKATQSEPVVVVKNGEVIEKNLSNLKLTVNELMALLREKNAFNICDVEFAIMEISGKLSVLKKSQEHPVTPSDLKIPTEYKGISKEIIIDGEIMYENLNDAKLDVGWLMSELKKRNIDNVNEVFFAALDTSGNLYTSKRHSEGESHGKYGID